MTKEREEKRECVEYYVGFAVFLGTCEYWCIEFRGVGSWEVSTFEHVPCARACTCVDFCLMHPNQIVPFTIIVAANAPIATGGNVTASLGPPGSSFVTDSCRICKNETIIMMEKTRMPRGSSLRLPTGNLC